MGISIKKILFLSFYTSLDGIFLPLHTFDVLLVDIDDDDDDGLFVKCLIKISSCCCCSLSLIPSRGLFSLQFSISFPFLFPLRRCLESGAGLAGGRVSAVSVAVP